VLARRAVARRTDRAGAAAGPRSETWGRTLPADTVSSLADHHGVHMRAGLDVTLQRMFTAGRLSTETIVSLSMTVARSGRDSVPRALTDEWPPEGTRRWPRCPQPCSQVRLPLASRLVTRIALSVAFGLGVKNSGRRASTTCDCTPISDIDQKNSIRQPDRRAPAGSTISMQPFHRLSRSDFAQSPAG
jgi:hypothetical protein